MSKNTKTPKEVAVQGFLLNGIFIIIFIVVGLFYVMPEYNKISAQKELANQLVASNTKLTYKGLAYSEFKKNSSGSGLDSLDLDDYTKNLLKNIDANFYKDNFVANSGDAKDYYEFLDNKEEEISIGLDELAKTNVDKGIQNILPEYSVDSSVNEESLTDFKFVNYIESLLDAFKLSSTDSIGVGNLQVVESFETGLSEQDSQKNLEGKIYFFPLELNVTGRKTNILDFIHYIENVGKIDIKENTVVINDYNNDPDLSDFKALARKFSGIDSKDIYNNLVMDIQKIELPEYIDSGELPSTVNTSFISFLKLDQGDEKYEVTLSLRFYVRGLPTYKIEDFIRKVNAQYKTVAITVVQQIKQLEKNKTKLASTKSLLFLNDMKSMNMYLQNLAKEIGSGLVAIKNKKGLGNEYKKAQEYQKIFGAIEESIADFNQSQMLETDSN